VIEEKRDIVGRKKYQLVIYLLMRTKKDGEGGSAGINRFGVGGEVT